MSFKRLRGVFLPFITVIIDLIWTIGFMNLLGRNINVVTILLPSLLLVIGCAYTIHFINQYYLEVNSNAYEHKKEIIVAAVKHIGKPLFFITMTTCIGFASLGVSQVVPIREFGLFLAFGILMLLILVFTFIPACLSLLKEPEKGIKKAQTPVILDKFLEIISKINTGNPYKVIVICIIFFLVFIAGVFRLRVENDNLAIFKKSDRITTENQFINKNLSGINIMNVVLESDEENLFTEPEILNKVKELQEYIESYPEVDDSQSIVDFLMLINKAMNNNNPEYKTIPANKNLISQYLLLYSMAGDPTDFNRLVDLNYKKIAIPYQVNVYNMNFYLKLAEKIKEWGKSNFPEKITTNVSGSLIITAKAFGNLVDTLVKSILLAFIIITILILILFKSVKLGIIAIIPNIFPILLNFGFMGWFGIPLDLPTSIFACVALGIAVDDTIHFCAKFKEELALCKDPVKAIKITLRITGVPIIITSISITTGFLVFLLSNFMPVFYFGLITAWVMVVCLFADLIFLPALLLVFLKGNAKEAALKK